MTNYSIVSLAALVVWMVFGYIWHSMARAYALKRNRNQDKRTND